MTKKLQLQCIMVVADMYRMQMAQKCILGTYGWHNQVLISTLPYSAQQLKLFCITHVIKRARVLCCSN